MTVKAYRPFRPLREVTGARSSSAWVDPLAERAHAASAGDEVEMHRLLHGVAPDILRVIRAVLGSTYLDVEHLVRECLLDFVRALEEFGYESSVSRFALTIAFCRALATQRRKGDFCGLTPSSENLDVERRRALVAGLLATIPEPQAEALGLRVVVGLSIQEIARATGVPANTARSRLRLAKEALRMAIEADPALREFLAPLQ